VEREKSDAAHGSDAGKSLTGENPPGFSGVAAFSQQKPAYGSD
jgi:hypothetical protein